jgi:hypothetical protein
MMTHENDSSSGAGNAGDNEKDSGIKEASSETVPPIPQMALLPCPFCGCTILEVVLYNRPCVVCQGCGADGPSAQFLTSGEDNRTQARAEARQLWNQRSVSSVEPQRGTQDTPPVSQNPSPSVLDTKEEERLLEEFKRNHHNPIVAQLNRTIEELEELRLEAIGIAAVLEAEKKEAAELNTRQGRPFDFSPWAPPFTYDPDGTRIVDSQQRLILDVRGTGFLTGKGSEALGMNKQEACWLQDALGEHVASLLNASSVPEESKSDASSEFFHKLWNEVEVTNALAEYLFSIGWKSPSDAQWTHLRESLPQIAKIIAPSVGRDALNLQMALEKILNESHEGCTKRFGCLQCGAVNEIAWHALQDARKAPDGLEHGSPRQPTEGTRAASDGKEESRETPSH